MVNEHQLVQQQVLTYLTERLGLEVPAMDTDLINEGGLDSLSFVDLVVYLEQRFDTRISADDLEIDRFRSVSRIAEFVCGRAAARLSWQGGSPDGDRAALL